MKYLIASDIHGSAEYCGRLLDAFSREKADRMILLGDILYHGPRNDLPEGYAPKKVIEQLNPLKAKLMCVRGNCDTEVDQMVLDFPVLADYAVIDAGNRLIYATHGHVYNLNKLPPMCGGDILLHGHTHVPDCTEEHGVVYINPGSVSIPKENSPHSYMTYENGLFLWKTLDGDEYKRYDISEGCGASGIR
ncbi:MAG: phosphodiesterase [Clostridia bacterium]|nr:phosphodiesterase [Clostridia bacterium]